MLNNKTKMLMRVGFAIMTLFVILAPTFNVLATEVDTTIFGLTDVAENSGLTGNADIKGTIGNLIKVALGFLGVLAVIIVLIGGFKYMTSGGEDEKTKKARNYIISGLIGVVIIVSAYAIVSFALTEFTGAIVAE